jgi:hypothetical protein
MEPLTLIATPDPPPDKLAQLFMQMVREYVNRERAKKRGEPPIR